MRKQLAAITLLVFSVSAFAQTAPPVCPVPASVIVPSYYTSGQPAFAQLNWTNGTDIVSAVTTNSAGTETAGPAQATVYRCPVSATQNCSFTSGVPTTASAWTVIPATNSQSLAETTNAGGPFYDTTTAFGTTYAYTVTLAWTGSLGGTPSGYAAPCEVVIPAASMATITSPTPGSTLTGASTTFTWNAGPAGTTGYYLWVGTSLGAADLVNIGPLSGTSATVNLPTNGATVYVRLWTVINGTTLLSNNYTYTEFTAAAPAAATSVTGSQVQ